MESQIEKKTSKRKISNKLLILILAVIIVINISIAFSYHIFEDNWITPVHHFAHRVIMIYHSISTPFIGIVLLLFLEFIEIRKEVVKPIKIMAIVGGVNCGIGATFWAYTDLFIIHHFFVGGLCVLFLCALVLCYGLIPGKEVRANDYYAEIPKIKGFNLIHLNALIIIIGMIVFTIFGAVAALIMLGEHEPFFLIEELFVNNRDDPKLLFQELASFHGRLTTALFLTGILTLVFRYTKVKGKAAKWGLWMLLAGSLAMTVGYFLMIFMGKSANAILMPARALILFTGVIIAVYAWIQVSKEDLGAEYERSSTAVRIKAVMNNPLRIAMYIPFFLAGLIVVIPGLIIVADLGAYRDPINRGVERTFATGHPHALITLAAIVVFCLLVHDLLPKNTWRKFLGWTLVASQVISFPIAAIYFLRDPLNPAMETAFQHIIISGLFLLLADILIYLVLAIRQAIMRKDLMSKPIKPLVIES